MTTFFSPRAAAAATLALLTAGLSPLTARAQTMPGPTPAQTLPKPAQAETLPAPTPSGSTLPAPAGAAPKPPTADVVRTRRLVRSVDENTDNIKAQGNFGAQLWLVEGRNFFEDWRKPETPSITPVEIVLRGHTIYTAIIFYGMGRDQGGLAKVTYNTIVRRPDGSVYEQRNDIIGWQNLAPGDDRQLLLGRDSLGITIGPDEPAGLYTVEATVRDGVSRVDLPLKSHFVVQ